MHPCVHVWQVTREAKTLEWHRRSSEVSQTQVGGRAGVCIPPSQSKYVCAIVSLSQVVLNVAELCQHHRAVCLQLSGIGTSPALSLALIIHPFSSLTLLPDSVRGGGAAATAASAAGGCDGGDA